MQKPTITYSDFAKLDLRVGTIVECLAVEKSEKLLNLTVDLGAELGERTILSGIKKYFEPEKLVGTQVLILANLESKKMMGLESQGMILMGVEEAKEQDGQEGLKGQEEKITLLIPQNKVPEGTEVE
ncbi:hypothetical protein COS54_01945 [Candidatus Shapirobacteria bacterium CG03_land_8_20_14_0_80_39_12]|uniref:Methionine--tRNA ligase n=1 Tax=Candidatus Shapirobacteria bacterium CG03_land_8_20_14_0_80_39_12 TaxID=1974879 RepID=A0A2M7BCY4_9BACT|nr:MAG: hypothetical protein COS54_01945 [Candidatus Shapirobacteria bacterium CG03_land_8_20_14_0_80_39_12]